ncbi:uncharacterized protein LOC128387440 [Panonychus citri]|uniref:uncharacterized protein LOC128387440 n=1 Tax=Panonychus citri TaxID=50023 RepID=UPI0023077F97|nr:uncharacterized protein LOC128387440 [Panonychus citri]
MAESLSSDEKINIETTVKPFALFSLNFDDYNIEKRKQSSGLTKLYHKVIKTLILSLLVRSIFVLWYEDDYVQLLLGYSYKTFPYLHWVIIFYLIYTYAVLHVGARCCHTNLYNLEFVEIFKLLNGTKLPQELGTNIKVVESLARYSHSKMATCRYVIGVRTVIGSVVFASIYLDDSPLMKPGTFQEIDIHSVAWAVLLTFFVFICSGIIYVTINLFDILGYYFQLRFHKVNQDIESIITARESPVSNVKVIELMKQILIEHDSLCWKLDHYNRYWCLIVMITFFVQPTIFVYTMYEICFMYQPWSAMILLWALNLESAYIFTRMFLIGVSLSDEIHHVYLRAVRASFAKYPLDLRLQIRIFIQRISGATIGFYCYDLFGLSRHSFYHALVHMGQNFFLIIDFVVSQKQAREQIALERAARAAALGNMAG